MRLDLDSKDTDLTNFALHLVQKNEVLKQLKTDLSKLASDQDNGDTLTYSLLSDSDGAFTINSSTGELMVANGEKLDYFPASTDDQAAVTPIYETMSGWDESTFGARSWVDLPARAIKYVRRIEELVGKPCALVSTSPEREDVILMQDPFEV